MTTVETESGEQSYRMPSPTCLTHAFKLGIVEDKEIKTDYWTSSLDKSVIIGVKSNQEKLLVKSEDEYTSPISRFIKLKVNLLLLQRILFT